MIEFLLALAIGQADGFPRRVEIDNLPSWPKEGRIVVEGVFTLIGEGTESYRPMRLKKSDVAFNVPRALLREKAPTGNIEVTGVVETLRGKTVIQVEDFKLLPPDERRFKQMLEDAGEDAEKLYRAADWAKRRYELYGSPAMEAAKRDAFEAGLKLERKLASGDPAKLAALKTKLQGRQDLSDFDFDTLNHEITRAEYDRVSKDDAAALMKFADKVFDNLLPARERGGAIDPRHRQAYDEKPLPTYDDAEPALRHALIRYFYSRIIDMALEANYKGGAAPFDLAQTAKEKVPEYREVARKWFRAWAKTQEGRLAELEGDAANDAATTMEKELEAFTESAKFRADWLEAREAKLRQREREAREESGATARVQRDADTWFDLGRRHVGWFPNSTEHETKAVRILEDILSFAPQYAKAEVELRRLGYVQLADGEWRRRNDRPEARKGAGVRALAINMSPAEVLATLGKPTYQGRAATASGATVVWIYRSDNRETLVVFSGPPDALRVNRIRSPGE